MSPGNPPAQYYFATPLTMAALSRTSDLGIDHGPSMGPDYKKYIHKFEIQTVLATAAPLTWELLDYLAYYPGIAMDTGVQGLTTGIALPRYTASEGVQIMVVEQNPYVGGARFAVTYTDDQGISRTSPTMTCNTQVAAGTLATTAPATGGCHGRYVPLAPGVRGVASIDSIEFFTSDVGLLCLVLVMPLLHGAIYTTGAPNYYELPRDYSDLVPIKDDAYLNLICQPVGTLSGAQIIGNITTIWSPV